MEKGDFMMIISPLRDLRLLPVISVVNPGRPANEKAGVAAGLHATAWIA
jgi:hypothetical protein